MQKGYLWPDNMVLNEISIHKKLENLDQCLEACLNNKPLELVPEIPKRDVEYLPINFLQGRLGIGNLEGQQKLLHDLANIELQAMELGLRTLMEFSWAPEEFKQQLVQIVLEEAKHLKMCLQGIESLGGYWGKWPVHLGLWHATHKKDSLLERLFIVHRYLEGSGLDAGDTLLRRLSGVNNKIINEIVDTIVIEEVGHVQFGSRWYKHYIEKNKINEKQFLNRILRLVSHRHPRKDKLAQDLRIKAGFQEFELKAIEEFRNCF